MIHLEYSEALTKKQQSYDNVNKLLRYITHTHKKKNSDIQASIPPWLVVMCSGNIHHGADTNTTTRGINLQRCMAYHAGTTWEGSCFAFKTMTNMAVL